MENVQERELLARRTAVPAKAEAREQELVAAAGKMNFRGVTYMPSGKWSAAITEPGSKKKQWLGTYPKADVAACAYDLAARSLRGDEAKTNFKYPPPRGLIAAVATAPGRRGRVFDTPPPPARWGLGQRATVLAPGARRITPEVPASTITFVRSTPPKPFSIQAAAADSRRVSNPVVLLVPPIRIMAPAPVRARSVETCFSSTVDDPDLQDSASSSSASCRR